MSKGSGNYWKGVPVEEYSREGLLEIVNTYMNAAKQERESAKEVAIQVEVPSPRKRWGWW